MVTYSISGNSLAQSSVPVDSTSGDPLESYRLFIDGLDPTAEYCFQVQVVGTAPLDCSETRCLAPPAQGMFMSLSLKLYCCRGMIKKGFEVHALYKPTQPTRCLFHTKVLSIQSYCECSLFIIRAYACRKSGGSCAPVIIFLMLPHAHQSIAKVYDPLQL